MLKIKGLHFFLLVPVLLLVTITESQAQLGDNQTLGDFDLQGKVKSMKEWRMNEEQGETYLALEVKFNEQGLLLAKTSFTPDQEIHQRWEYSYDGQNNLLEEKELDNRVEAAIYRKTAAYDSDGKIVSGISYNPDGSIARSLKVIYNEKGQQTEVLEDLKNDESSRKQVFSYDEKGNKTVESEFLNGDLIRTHHFTYDGEGKILEEVSQRGGEKHPYLKKIYDYDATGKKVSEKEIDFDEDGKEEAVLDIVYQWNEKGRKQKEQQEYKETDGRRWYTMEVVYDKQGNPVREKRAHSVTSLSFEYQMQYEYDESENWTRKSPLGDQEEKGFIIRELVYF